MSTSKHKHEFRPYPGLFIDASFVAHVFVVPEFLKIKCDGCGKERRIETKKICVRCWDGMSEHKREPVQRYFSRTESCQNDAIVYKCGCCGFMIVFEESVL